MVIHLRTIVSMMYNLRMVGGILLIIIMMPAVGVAQDLSLDYEGGPDCPLESQVQASIHALRIKHSISKDYKPIISIQAQQYTGTMQFGEGEQRTFEGASCDEIIDVMLVIIEVAFEDWKVQQEIVVTPVRNPSQWFFGVGMAVDGGSHPRVGMGPRLYSGFWWKQFVSIMTWQLSISTPIRSTVEQGAEVSSAVRTLQYFVGWHWSQARAEKPVGLDVGPVLHVGRMRLRYFDPENNQVLRKRMVAVGMNAAMPIELPKSWMLRVRGQLLWRPSKITFEAPDLGRIYQPKRWFGEAGVYVEWHF